MSQVDKKFQVFLAGLLILKVEYLADNLFGIVQLQQLAKNRPVAYVGVEKRHEHVVADN